MARPYSQDLRDRVIGSVASGRACRATAALFGVSVASVVKWSQRWRTSGSTATKPMGGWAPHGYGSGQLMIGTELMLFFGLPSMIRSL
jgi:transposase